MPDIKKIIKEYSLGNPNNRGFWYYTGNYQYTGIHHMPLLSLQAWGQFAKNTIFQRYRRWTIARPYSDIVITGKNHEDKGSPAIQAHRKKWGEGMWIWKNEPQEYKDAINEKYKSHRYKFNGFGYYMHRYILDLSKPAP